MFFSKSTKWLLVFLGNPGKEYRDTRLNVGFWVADRLSALHGISIKRIKYSALTGTGLLEGQRVCLLLPQTYMNLSGGAVWQAASSLRIPPERTLVIADDVSLAPGKLRIRTSGSAGGHNGLKSIISSLNTDQFPRVKIGVGSPPHPDYDMADWVLGRPLGEERRVLDAAVERTAEAVAVILTYGTDTAMNRFN